MLGEPNTRCFGGGLVQGTVGGPGARGPGPEIVILVVALQYCEQATGLPHELLIGRVVHQLQP
eukprot:10925342-Lingulodinium_polyedra.AAC.1